MTTPQERADNIKKEFLAEELDYIDTIEALCRIGYWPMDAEDLVTSWEMEKGHGRSPASLE